MGLPGHGSDTEHFRCNVSKLDIDGLHRHALGDSNNSKVSLDVGAFAFDREGGGSIRVTIIIECKDSSVGVDTPCHLLNVLKSQFPFVNWFADSAERSEPEPMWIDHRKLKHL